MISSNILTESRGYYDALYKQEDPLDLSLQDNIPPQVGLVTVQSPFFTSLPSYPPAHYDSTLPWPQVPCPPTIPAIHPSSFSSYAQHDSCSVPASTSSSHGSLPYSLKQARWQRQSSTSDDIFRRTEYQLALDYNHHSPHIEPCKTEAMKQ